MDSIDNNDDADADDDSSDGDNDRCVKKVY